MADLFETTLPSLSKTNFGTWKTEIVRYLMVNDLSQFLEEQAEPSSPHEIALFRSKKSKTAGILIFQVDEMYINKFYAEFRTEDPAIIWKAIVSHFESNSDENQAKVFLDFLTLSFKSNNLATFLADINRHLSALSSVGLVIGPRGSDLKESLVAELIVSKLPQELSSTKELIFTRRPLTIQVVKDLLTNKIRDSTARYTSEIKAEPHALSVNQKTFERCRNGWHNPSRSHKASECRQLNKKQAKLVVADGPGSDKFTVTASGLSCIAKAYIIRKPNKVFLDSKSSHHMFPDRSQFVNYKRIKSVVETAHGNLLEVLGQGSVRLMISDGTLVELSSLHVPKLVRPVISFGRLFSKGCEVVRTSAFGFDLVFNRKTLLSTKIINGVCCATVKLVPGSEEADILV